MKITEFVLTDRIPEGFGGAELHAQVSVTTGMLWWKKCERKRVFKPAYHTSWRWLDTGEFTPGFAVEALADAYAARERLTTKEMT